MFQSRHSYPMVLLNGDFISLGMLIEHFHTGLVTACRDPQSEVPPFLALALALAL